MEICWAKMTWVIIHRLSKMSNGWHLCNIEIFRAHTHFLNAPLVWCRYGRGPVWPGWGPERWGPVLIGAEVDRKRYLTHSVSGDSVQEIMTCSHYRICPSCLLSYQTAKQYANCRMIRIKRRLAVGAWQIGSNCALSETFNQPFNSRKIPSLSRLIKFDISETGKSKECN